MARRSLQSEIIDFIQAYIADNDLQPGDRLPPQANLTAMMQVSMASLREALKTLEGQNLLKIRNGKGIYVGDGSPAKISTQMVFTREKESIIELLEARRVLEHEIISLVVQRASDAELDEIAEVLARLMERYHRGEEQHEIDHAFHALFYKYCHNRVMKQLMESIDALFSTLWSSPLGMTSPFTNTIPLHQDLYDHVRARNIRKAQSVNDRIIRMDIEEVQRATFPADGAHGARP